MAKFSRKRLMELLSPSNPITKVDKTALALELRVSRQALHDYTTGKRKPSGERVADIARLFDKPMEFFYDF
jgi:DNA-binding XRE family transcriptional regulator